MSMAALKARTAFPAQSLRITDMVLQKSRKESMKASARGNRRLCILSAAFPAFLLVAGCGDGGTAGVASNVAAKVNASAITIDQLNAVLASIPDASLDTNHLLTRQIFDRLIDQQLAAEQAESRGFAHYAGVAAAIESARREILARAYFDSLVASQPKPSAREVGEYYAAHPELFAQRRIYTLKELTLPSGPDAAAFSRQAVAAGESIFDVARFLQEKGFRVNLGASIRSAEELPLELLPKLAQLPEGGLIVFEAPTGIYLAQLVSSQSAPHGETEAAPMIEQFLQNQRSREAIEEAVKGLRAAAKIEYFGDFAEASRRTAQASTAIALAPLVPSGNSGQSGEMGAQTRVSGIRQAE